MGEIAVIEPHDARRSVTIDMATRFGMEPAAFEQTLRATVFQEGSREEFAAFLLVAKEYDLNPITREIYAMKKQGGGIIPVVAVDGWIRLCNDHPNFDGVEFDVVSGENGKPVSTTARIYRKDRARPISVTEYYSECHRNTNPWKDMPFRMLRHKALIQCARVAFGFSGIFDEDEAERFADRPRQERRPPEPPARQAEIRSVPATIEHAPAMTMPDAITEENSREPAVSEHAQPEPTHQPPTPPRPPAPPRREPTPEFKATMAIHFDADAIRKRFAIAAAKAKDEAELGAAWEEIVLPFEDQFFPPDIADIQKIYRFRHAELDDAP